MVVFLELSEEEREQALLPARRAILEEYIRWKNEGTGWHEEGDEPPDLALSRRLAEAAIQSLEGK